MPKSDRASVIIGCILVSLWLGPPVWAQEKSLTLGEAIVLALKSNPDLTVESTRLDLASGEVTRARIYPFNPELHVESGLGKDRAIDNGDSGFAYDVRAGVSQVLELKGQQGLRLRRAKANAHQAEWLVKDAERLVRAGVARVFSQVILAQERGKLASEIVTLTRELSRVTRELFAADSVPRLDVSRAEVEAHQATNELTAAERELAVTKRDLTLLMGQPAGLTYQALGPLLYSPRQAEIERLKTLALANRPDLKAVGAGVHVAEAEVALVRAEHVFPTLELTAQYERGREIDKQSDRAIIGVSIPLPILNRRQGDLEIAFAERSRQTAQVELIKTRIEKEVPQAFERLGASQQIVEQFAQRILPQQEENFALLRQGYRLGQFNLTDVLVVQREFIQSRLRYLEAVSEFNGALVDLEEAVGISLITTEERP